MKNQYFGDINDYRKYGLLRALADCGRTRIVVCWMLTEDDGGVDGNKTRYLSEPNRWRRFDPFLFDALRDAVLERNHRDVRVVEAQNLIPSAAYHTDIVTDHPMSRVTWFDHFLMSAKDSDLVFFDPDNGMEVKSKAKGNSDSRKYVYWDEIVATYNEGHSLLVYQHFPRRPREAFVQEVEQAILIKVGARAVHVFRTSHVAFFLVVRPEHLERLTPLAEAAKTKWRGEIL